jgi:hypothetical protein
VRITRRHSPRSRHYRWITRRPRLSDVHTIGARGSRVLCRDAKFAGAIMSPAFWCGTLPAGPNGSRWFVCLIKRTSLALRLCCRLDEPNACVFHITTWSPPISTLNLTSAGRRLSGHGMPVDRPSRMRAKATEDELAAEQATRSTPVKSF